MMEIRRFISDKLSSNMYLLVETGHALVIDPCEDVSPADGLTVDLILLTHEHYDHISGVGVWKEATGAPVLCSEACARNIESPKRNLARYFPALCEMQTWVRLDRIPDADLNYSCRADKSFRDQTTLTWHGHRLELFELPGHSAGGVGILMDNTLLFSGDSLLPGTETELRFPGGDREAWTRVSIPRIRALDGQLSVYPGHFEPFILDKWRTDNGIF